MQSLQKYQDYINEELHKRISVDSLQEPKGLYDPCKYILRNGGKRVRAAMVLMSSHMFGGSYSQAIDVALAFETFHNFTLIHDDIMDGADIRRGQATVHVKWDTNTAILSGDAVMILAYKFFENAKDYLYDIFPLLNTTALEVCEGQQLDVDLEKAQLLDSFVTEDVYLRMIELKTSVLLAACLKAGAIVGGADATDADKLYEIGRLLGIGFQLQDDILDTFGNQDTFGKTIGGDIRENKKTFLVIKALQSLSQTDKEELLKLFSSKEFAGKYESVLALFNKANVLESVGGITNQYFDKALQIIDSIEIPEPKKQELYTFIAELRKRDY